MRAECRESAQRAAEEAALAKSALKRATANAEKVLAYLEGQYAFMEGMGVGFAKAIDARRNFLLIALTVEGPGRFCQTLERIPDRLFAARAALSPLEKSRLPPAPLPDFLEKTAAVMRFEMSRAEGENPPLDRTTIDAYRAYAQQYVRVGLDRGDLAQDVEWASAGVYLRGQDLRKLGAPRCARIDFAHSVMGVEDELEKMFEVLEGLSALRVLGLRKVRAEIVEEVSGIEAFLSDPAAWYAERGIPYGDGIKRVYELEAPAYFSAYRKALARVDWELSEIDRPE